jgi:glycosyltransferase involved in cell wall biosynthesis
MRVLVAHGRYRSAVPSGENVVVDQETSALEAAGVEVVRFERASDEITTWSPARRATIPVKAVWNGEAKRSLAVTIREHRPDVVHVHNTFPLLSPAVLVACAEARVPVVTTLHNYRLVCPKGDLFRDDAPCLECIQGTTMPALAHGCYRGSRVATAPLIASLVLNRRRWNDLVSAFIFVSATQRDLMEALDIPPERAFVKHNFVPGGAQPRSRRDHVVAYVGRLSTAKGTPLLMDAWDAFRRRHPTSALHLRVVGSGDLLDDVMRWARSHPSVEVLGSRSRDEAHELMANSLAVVAPSAAQETFGLVPVEAMSLGVAPIAPDRGPFTELIRSGVDGALYRPADVMSLAETFAQVDRDPATFITLGKRGHDSYLARFVATENIARLLEIYSFAIDNPIV